jgi:membrane-associated phospholipid phosphatase
VVSELFLTSAPSATAETTPGRPGRPQAIAGLILVGWTLVAGVAVHRHPGPNGLDRWGFSALGPSLHSSVLIRITDLGGFTVLAGGSVLAALVVVSRDRWRAVACLCGPALAAVLVEWLIKPMVGRRYLEVLTFPSGSVTAVAALATAWVLAVPGWLRVAVSAAGSVVVVAMMVAVVALRWHYPSDALAGAAFGVGVVLSVDGILQMVGAKRASGQVAGVPAHPQR